MTGNLNAAISKWAHVAFSALCIVLTAIFYPVGDGVQFGELDPVVFQNEIVPSLRIMSSDGYFKRNLRLMYFGHVLAFQGMLLAASMWKNEHDDVKTRVCIWQYLSLPIYISTLLSDYNVHSAPALLFSILVWMNVYKYTVEGRNSNSDDARVGHVYPKMLVIAGVTVLHLLCLQTTGSIMSKNYGWQTVLIIGGFLSFLPFSSTRMELFDPYLGAFPIASGCILLINMAVI